MALVIRAPYPDAGGGMRLWTPNDLAVKPVGWFDMMDFVASNGSAISSVSNKGTAGGNFPQANAGLQPTYSTNTGGYPALVGNGSQFLEMPAALRLGGATPRGLFTVGDATGTMSPPSYFVGWGSGGGPNVGYAIANNGGQPYGDVSAFGFFLGSGSPSFTGTTLADMTYSSDLHRGYVNGTEGGTLSQTANTDASQPGAVGKWPAYGSSWLGNIREIIWLDYEPTLADRQFIEGYRAWRWGAQAKLPSGHPYKSAPPMVAA